MSPQLCCKRVVLNVCGGATGDMYVTRHSRATVGGLAGWIQDDLVAKKERGKGAKGIIGRSVLPMPVAIAKGTPSEPSENDSIYFRLTQMKESRLGCGESGI